MKTRLCSSVTTTNAYENSTKLPIYNTTFNNKVPICEIYHKNLILPESLKLLCPLTVKSPFNF